MSTPAPVFAPRRTGMDAARAVAAHLALWLPARPETGQPGSGTYLPASRTARGLTTPLSALLPTTVAVARVFEARPGTHPPFVRVLPMEQRTVDRDSEAITVDCTIHVYSIVTGETTSSTADLLTCYEDAVVACLEQQPVAGTDGVWWLGGGDGEEVVDSEDERTRQGRVDVFTVRLENALSLRAGPRSPADPTALGYPADLVGITVDPAPVPLDPIIDIINAPEAP